MDAHHNKSPLTAYKMYIKAKRTADGCGGMRQHTYRAIILIICQRIEGTGVSASCRRSSSM